MKKRFQASLFGLLVLFFLASVAIAQEQTEVTVHIEKDGKVVKDTTYKFESDNDAEGKAVTLEKRVKVIVTEDENGEKHMTKEEIIGGDKEVIIIKKEDKSKQ